MPPTSRPPSRCSARLRKRKSTESELPYSHPITVPAVVSSRSAPTEEWTWEQKLAHFQNLPPILCPASPPPIFAPSETVEQAQRRSRQRIEQMTKRLSNQPLYQARHLLQLASTELKGPFSPGCKYWGTIAPEPKVLLPEDLVSLGQSFPKPVAHTHSQPIGPLQIDIADIPRFSTPSAPGPSSTVITGPSTPFTPPSASRAPTKLIPSKTNSGRELVPIDFDPPSPNRSPTPTPSLPPSRMGSQALSGSRPPETPGSASRRLFILNLQQASQASSVRSRRTRPRISRGLKILPSVGPPLVARERVANPDRAESRDQSPLSRFSQRGTKSNPGSQRAGPSRQQSQAPIASQQETAETYTYNSEFSVERHIDEIGRFMEDDIGG
ncbi:unnamed protein product [Rhizoctonia solani]|uniref:Uncharacterized protein n=1 Tax=Rhizoctonia solani TaxID=456999 RepID=A0A8H3BL75_9AGAM|nr:unnamed protein product [Rhizoctonia solani]